MKNSLPILFVLLFAVGCKDKQVDLSGETPIKVADFMGVFKKITGNYLVADTNINKVSDTLTIGYKALLQFFPDSAVAPVVGNSKKVVIHPVGIIEKDKEKYLLLNFNTGKKQTKLAVFVTDEKNRFLGSKELLNTNHNDGYLHSVSINREPTFLISKEKVGKDNAIQYSRTGWVYNSAGIFMVVINDSNEDPKKMVVINPIDTLPRKNKYSGDYVQDKKNYISIRDTHKPDVYQFFIHFEKNEGGCTGELKGEMKFRSPNTAVFTENGDPCVIDFTFSGNEITVKEQGSCGNHRGIKCYFDDTFVKKKEPKKKAAK